MRAEPRGIDEVPPGIGIDGYENSLDDDPAPVAFLHHVFIASPQVPHPVVWEPMECIDIGVYRSAITFDVDADVGNMVTRATILEQDPGQGPADRFTSCIYLARHQVGSGIGGEELSSAEWVEGIDAVEVVGE